MLQDCDGGLQQQSAPWSAGSASQLQLPQKGHYSRFRSEESTNQELAWWNSIYGPVATTKIQLAWHSLHKIKIDLSIHAQSRPRLDHM